MSSAHFSTAELANLVATHNGNLTAASKAVGIPRSTIWNRLKTYQVQAAKQPATVAAKNKVTVDDRGDFVSVDYLGDEIVTPEELIARAGVDLSIYEIDRVTLNNWETAGKKDSKTWQGIYKTGLRQIKIVLRRKRDDQVAVERLLDALGNKSTVRLKVNYPKPVVQKHRRALEVSIMDPHYGMQCYKGESGDFWSLEQCAKLCLWSVDSLLARAKAYGSYDEIVFPFGNDFMHHDNLNHTTTKGTLQPEGLSYLHTSESAIKLAVTMIDRLSSVAPVRVIQVSGNHDQVSSFTIGHVLKAYYRNDQNVTVDVSPAPYKFYRFGTNLIGFDHGHHIKPIRLASIMAHECREDWARTTFREWHLGDQHRKGSGSPVIMEEQGVGVEYLPALTPPNAWHKLKGFNWQQRGAMAFVWDYNEGPLARLQVNLNSYTGKPTGQ